MRRGCAGRDRKAYSGGVSQTRTHHGCHVPPQGLQVELFENDFEHLSLKPLTEAQQQQLIEKRLSGNEKGLSNEKARVDELSSHLRTRVPLDTETGMRMTGNPLMLSMIISSREHGRDA